MVCHPRYQLGIGGFLRIPAQYGFCLGGIAPEIIHIGGTEPLGIYADQQLAGLRVVALLVHARTFPADGHAVGGKGTLGKVPDGVLLTGGNDEILRGLVLQHEPHALHIVFGIAPVPKGVHVAQLQMILKALGDPPGRQRDLPGDKILTPALGLVVEENAVDGEHAVGLPVLLYDPVAVLLGDGVGGVGVEGGSLPLGDLLYLAEEFGGGRLIHPGFLRQPQDPAGFQDPQYAQRVHVSGVFRYVKADLHVALGCQIVNFVRLHQPDDPDQRAAVGQIAVVEPDPSQQVVNAGRVGNGSPPGNAVNLIALIQQKFRQIASVLPCNSGNQRLLHKQSPF